MNVLIRIMKWKPDLDRVPLLIREVFHIHVIFISITLSIFALPTWRFAHEIGGAANPLAIWLATAIGLFWIARSVMQWLHYSSSHWQGNAARTLIHWTLFLGYGAMGPSISQPPFGETHEHSAARPSAYLRQNGSG